MLGCRAECHCSGQRTAGGALRQPFFHECGQPLLGDGKTDINRMLPGYDQGETTQRIAAALFQAVQGYKYGIHFASFYLPGNFVPHVRIMNTGYRTVSLGNLFGLPYADVVRVQDFYPRPP